MRSSSGAIARRIASSLRPLMRPHFTEGNRIRLLPSAQHYFPAVLDAISTARRLVHLETYIFADDRVGRSLMEALAGAARRGLDVRVLIDGFGGGDFARQLAAQLPQAGAQVRIYGAERWWRPRRRLLRRMHRKLVVIDDRLAYLGGINVNDEPQRDEFTGEPIGPRFDVAIQCEGPIVAAIATAMRRLWWAVAVTNWSEMSEPAPRRVRPTQPMQGGMRAALVLRDNLRNRHSIERSYLSSFRSARRQILVASAYFLPGRRMRAALVRAARRGVRVRLLLQGRVEYRLQHYAQRALYGQLLAAGIEIHEYQSSYLHAKVAVVDEDWATVGSSNIDPLSLLLAREANVVVQDRGFASELRTLIEYAVEAHSRPLHATDYARRSWVARLAHWMAYGLVRAATVVLARGSNY
ncbi:MAG TPA: cardiolipin synthase ClsB [Burkholderiaceae bacterium]|nr:cardiolipin synthase ClsB [Burkholderiaceae bacterium]